MTKPTTGDLQWEVIIWTHDGVQKEFIADGSETIDELIKSQGWNAQDVNGIEINPMSGRLGNATKTGK